MKIDIASWRTRILVYWRDPARAMGEALASSGPLRRPALMTLPLWMTPSLYHQHLGPTCARSGRAALWAAAGLWVVTMNLMLSPAVPLIQAAVARLGTGLGYWDDMFTGTATTAVLMAASCFILFSIAAVRWTTAWLACILDAIFGGMTVSPPSFGYYATQTAGEIAAVAASVSALIFAAKPLNAPVWTWLHLDGPIQMVIIAGVSAIILACMHLKRRVLDSAAREIYGKPGKALAYEFGLPSTVVLALCFAAHHVQ